MVWKPAEGGEAMSAEEWTHQAEDAPSDGAAPTAVADGAGAGSAGTAESARGRAAAPTAARAAEPAETEAADRAEPADATADTTQEADA